VFISAGVPGLAVVLQGMLPLVE